MGEYNPNGKWKSVDKGLKKFTKKSYISKLKTKYKAHAKERKYVKAREKMIYDAAFAKEKKHIDKQRQHEKDNRIRRRAREIASKGKARVLFEQTKTGYKALRRSGRAVGKNLKKMSPSPKAYSKKNKRKSKRENLNPFNFGGF